MKLSQLTGEAPVVAMLGMCKNAGKTTALNRLINEYAGGRRNIAITSVGRDGESTDLVTGTEKPPIYMYEGMLAATASELLGLSDVSREILEATDITTPLGRVVVFRARSDGFVQLAGPSVVSTMHGLRMRLCELGADTVLIDGALSRRSPASGALDGVCVLCTGASLDRDMDTVVSETAFAARLLTLEEEPGAVLGGGKFTIECAEGRFSAETADELCAALKKRPAEKVMVAGALTDQMADKLLRSGAKLEGLRMIAEDGSRILMKKERFERLASRGAVLRVLRGTRLAAVTINPVSAGGWRFDGSEFLDKMSAASPAPVLDVERI